MSIKNFGQPKNDKEGKMLFLIIVLTIVGVASVIATCQLAWNCAAKQLGVPELSCGTESSHDQFIEECHAMGITYCKCRCIQRGGVERMYPGMPLEDLLLQLKYPALYWDCAKDCK